MHVPIKVYEKIAKDTPLDYVNKLHRRIKKEVVIEEIGGVPYIVYTIVKKGERL